MAKIQAPSSPSADTVNGVAAQLSGAATVAVKTAMGQVVNDIDSDTIASTVGPKVAEQVAPAVTEKVTSSEKLAAAKQSAVQQVAAAIPDINTDELKSLMGEFKDLSSQAGEMMDSVDTLTGALYNACLLYTSQSSECFRSSHRGICRCSGRRRRPRRGYRFFRPACAQMCTAHGLCPDTRQPLGSGNGSGSIPERPGTF